MAGQASVRDTPPMQLLAQVPLPQAALALGWTQLKHVGPGPHCVTSVSLAQVDEQRCVPGVGHVKSQTRWNRWARRSGARCTRCSSSFRSC